MTLSLVFGGRKDLDITLTRKAKEQLERQAAKAGKAPEDLASEIINKKLREGAGPK